ncbi:MAG: hypothetical protein GY842_04280 [bacterium]|nr:hypothetical protein [bacterium]
MHTTAIFGRTGMVVLGVAVFGAVVQPGWAGPARSEQAEDLMRAWVGQATPAAPVPGWDPALPQGTRLDEVQVLEHAAAAYVTLPAEFLADLTDIECERIVRGQVEQLRQVEGVTTFLLFARPAGDPEAEYRPLPDFLPQPTGELDKPEPEGGLRSGGLPTYNPGQPGGALSGKTVFLSPGHGWYYSDTLLRWATQRGNWGGVIEDMSNGEAVLNHLARYLHNAGANVWTCRERDFNTNMVIVDNGAGAPGYTTAGSWTNSTAAGTWYGSNYQYSAVNASETAVATFAPLIPEAGFYAVYVWTPSASNRSTDAQVRVNHTGGTTTHILHMQRDGNTWRFLGRYYFAAGRNSSTGSVEVSNQGSDPSKYVIADAVRFGGGMGDYSEGGSVSGWPRWEESGRYFPVFMGHTSTPYGTVTAMPRYAKWENESWEDSIYFSWHSNATGSHTGHGTQMYVYATGNEPPGPFGDFDGVVGGNTLATRIFDEVMNDIHVDWDAGWPGGKYSAWFGELNPTYNNEMPACLIEVAYHDSATDQPSLLDPRFRDLVARACYQGIVDWWYNDADGPSATAIPFNTLLPEPPTHLAVRRISADTVRVSWDAPPFNSGDGLLGAAATGYLVQMSRDGFGFDDGTATANTAFDVGGLDAGTVYYLRVIATNAGGQSFPTEIGGVKLDEDGVPPVLVVNGFDRLDRSAMLSEDDPYDADPMLRERLERMNHYGYARTFAEALDAIGVAFDWCSNEALRDDDVDPAPYQAVIWQSGEESTGDDTFDSVEQSRLTTYLSGGGKLFVSGAEIGWDLDHLGNGTSFYNNYLKASYSADDAGTYTAASVAGSIFDGIGSFTFDDGSTIYNVDYPDVITPSGGSAAALSYVGGTGGSAGVTYDGAFRLVHFGFPFETITDSLHRVNVMAAVIDFFDIASNGLVPVEVIVESREVDGDVTPAPTYAESGAWGSNDTVKSTVGGLVGLGSRYTEYTLPNPGTDHATFVPALAAAGKYEVFATWGNEANCRNAQFTVTHFHGDTVLLLNQMPDTFGMFSNANRWVSLGEYWFEGGQDVATASVDLSEETVTSQPEAAYPPRVYADAVRWDPLHGWPDGDSNGDQQIDLVDFASFQSCMTGPSGGYAEPDCWVFDFDVDSDVDLDDFAPFQCVFGGG